MQMRAFTGTIDAFKSNKTWRRKRTHIDGEGGYR
jgi:hypothetical protein